MTLETQQALGLTKAPIAIGFLDAPPPGMSKWNGPPVPAGCSFWAYAWDCLSFYTEPSDHYNCAVGSYVHGISLPEDKGPALQDTIGFMVGNGYLRMAEVPGIPVLPKPPAFIAYAIEGLNKFPADVVLIALKPAAAMLIYEAALLAGAGDALTPALGRPACAVLPLALNSGKASLSFGCKGNRTFTGLRDEELYMAIPGSKWGAVVEAAESILKANGAMEAHYKAHEASVRGV
jgi:uncharacterized protein (DUF169 family)